MFKEKIKAVSTAVTKNVVNPMQEFYKNNASTVNATGAITFSMLSTGVAMRNSRKIIDIIEDFQDIYPTLPKEERKTLIKAALKELVPLILPIITFQAMAVTFIMLNKKQLDDANKQIADLTAALVMANNAISQYQEFQKKAEAELSEKKVDKIKKEIAKEDTEKHPQTPENTMNAPYANQNFLYWSTNSKKYINSRKSPVEIENFCKQAAYDLKDGNYFNDEFTYADIYEFMAENITPEESKFFGWEPKDVVKSGICDSSSIRIDIIPGEKDDHQTLCYDLTFHGHKLFK